MDESWHNFFFESLNVSGEGGIILIKKKQNYMNSHPFHASR